MNRADHRKFRKLRRRMHLVRATNHGLTDRMLAGEKVETQDQAVLTLGKAVDLVKAVGWFAHQNGLPPIVWQTLAVAMGGLERVIARIRNGG